MFKIGQSVICVDDTPRGPIAPDVKTPVKGYV